MTGNAVLSGPILFPVVCVSVCGKTLNPSANTSDYGFISGENVFCRWDRVETVVKRRPPVSVRLLSVVDWASRGALACVCIRASDLAAFSIKLPCATSWRWWDKSRRLNLPPASSTASFCSSAALRHTVSIVQQTPCEWKFEEKKCDGD